MSEFNGNKQKRKDYCSDNRNGLKAEIKISRHYWITEKIHIELIKIASRNKVNISYVVRMALKEFINNENTPQ